MDKWFGMFYVNETLVELTPKTDCALAWLVLKGNKVLVKDLEKTQEEFLEWCGLASLQEKEELIKRYADRIHG